LTLRVRNLDTITAETVDRASLETTTTRSRAVRPSAALPCISDTRVSVTSLHGDGLSTSNRARGVELRGTIATDTGDLTLLGTTSADEGARGPCTDVPAEGDALASVAWALGVRLLAGVGAVGVVDGGTVGGLAADHTVLKGATTGLRALRPVGGIPVIGDTGLGVTTARGGGHAAEDGRACLDGTGGVVTG